MPLPSVLTREGRAFLALGAPTMLLRLPKPCRDIGTHVAKSQNKSGFIGAEGTRVLQRTTRADCAYHDRERLSGVGEVGSVRRKTSPATGKSRELEWRFYTYHTHL